MPMIYIAYHYMIVFISRLPFLPVRQTQTQETFVGISTLFSVMIDKLIRLLARVMRC